MVWRILRDTKQEIFNLQKDLPQFVSRFVHSSRPIRVADLLNIFLFYLCLGGVKVIIDVGFERDEVNTNIQNVDLSNNQQHVVDVKRSDKGRTITLRVNK